jgi:glycosyltransferase involved in cell wall biosynthesis
MKIQKFDIDDAEFRNNVDILISLIIPVFNEEGAIFYFIKRINEIFHPTSFKLELIFINDGSNDNTLARLLELKFVHPEIIVLDLTRNFGKEAALSAGLNKASGNVIIPIDVDLQDPPELIIDMIQKWREGFDVVLGKRINRDSDSWFKRKSASWFYRIHNFISEPTIPENVGDFRLMDSSVVSAINELPESRRFMKGLFAWVGFRTIEIEYIRPQRIIGETKFNGWSLWNFALEGITSFSTKPLRIWFYIGILVAFLSFLFASLLIFKVLIFGVEIPGYASILVSITFLGGLQLIGIGIIGEYLGRSYIESKRRPIYLIRKIY